MAKDYPYVGDPIDPDNFPAIFELILGDHLVSIDPAGFEVKDAPHLDPARYFITSGDALSKAIRLENDLWKLAGELRKLYYKHTSAKYRAYTKAVWRCAGQCRSLVNKLYKAKGPNCFLETEWRDQILIVIPKNPRVRPK